MDRKQVSLIRRRLLRWYDRNARDLPWRRRRDPYTVWVSEIMLQQTRVAAVVPYFKRFMKRFATLDTLARARQDTVLKQWEGLGYYGRARNLHAGAQQVVREFGGQIPDSREELLRIKGIGRYTAGAILSIAYGRAEPILDGNVIRVLCRLVPVRKDPGAGRTRERLWRISGQLVTEDRPGDFNEALMELGALICLPKGPQCSDCPLEDQCKARLYGHQDRLPVRRKAKPIPLYDVAVGVVWKEGKVLITQRKPEGLLGGLWEFPGGKRKGGESFKTTVAREILEETGIEVAVGAPLVRVKHAYSHFKVDIRAFSCVYVSGNARAKDCAAVKWVHPAQLGRYAFPAANKTILEAISTDE